MKTIPQFWDAAIHPALVDYVRIPAKSPHFDRDWAKSGYVEVTTSKGAENAQ